MKKADFALLNIKRALFSVSDGEQGIFAFIG
jgi:hypothetical protein